MGKFYTDEHNRPCFQFGNEEVENILTHKIPGMKLVVNSNPKELIPGEYTYIGEISNRTVKFNRVVSYTNDSVETYAGEFTVGQNAAIQFPTSIYWTYETLNMYGLGIGCTYQYIIQHGLGRLIEYVNPQGDWGWEGWEGKFESYDQLPS